MRKALFSVLAVALSALLLTTAKAAAPDDNAAPSADDALPMDAAAVSSLLMDRAAESATQAAQKMGFNLEPYLKGRSSLDFYELGPLNFWMQLNPANADEILHRCGLTGQLLPSEKLNTLLTDGKARPLRYLSALLLVDSRHRAQVQLPLLMARAADGAQKITARPLLTLDPDGRSAFLNELRLKSNIIAANRAAGLEPVKKSAENSVEEQALRGPDAPESEHGALLISIPESAARAGASLQQQALPNDGMRFNLPALALRGMLQELVMYSHVDQEGFRQPASPFDRHLYARFADHFVAGDKFAALGQGCSLEAQYNCGLYFVGPEVSKVLKDAGRNSVFYIKDDLYGIPVLIEPGGLIKLKLRSTLLSNSGFVNYGNLTEVELALLQDLGLNLPRQSFYGRSIYADGGAAKKNEVQVNLNFSHFDPERKSYTKKPSLFPMAVGVHLYGSDNNVIYNGSASIGSDGALGVRIDGSKNLFTLPYKTTVAVSGAGSAALALSSGRDNLLNIAGTLRATGPDSSALVVARGSNVFSNYSERQGSYLLEGAGPVSLSSLPAELSGPAASRINISGSLEGRRSALLVARSSYVGDINLLSQARIKGDIAVLFEPTQSQLELMHEAGLNTEELELRLNLAASLQEALNFEEISREGDPKAQIKIEGQIYGPNLGLWQWGGTSDIEGSINARTLYLRRSVMRLNMMPGQKTEVKYLRLNRGSALDLLNGQVDTLQVTERAFVSAKSSLRVDVDADGALLDNLVFDRELAADTGRLILEPGVSYDTLKRLQANPKTFLTFLQNFVSSANEMLKDHSTYVSFPRHIWDIAGSYGREINCSARGCRIGSFVRDSGSEQDTEPWQYVLSAGGFVVLLGGTWLYLNAGRLHRALRRLRDFLAR